MQQHTKREVLFTAADVKKVAGLTYRQINDWDEKGVLPGNHELSHWRKFDIRELFTLLLCATIRRHFGVRLKKLAWLKSSMLRKQPDYFQTTLLMMGAGVDVFMFSDLRRTLHVDADIAIADRIRHGECRQKETGTYVLVFMNPLVTKVLKETQDTVQLQIQENCNFATYPTSTSRAVKTYAIGGRGTYDKENFLQPGKRKKIHWSKEYDCDSL
jgi:hypothetical protein